MSPLQDLYCAALSRDNLREDPAQLGAVAELNRLREELLASRRKPGIGARLASLLAASPGPPVRGVYLWGGVGRGKTFLMDLFHDSLPIERKLRSHFHRFMNQIHAEMRRVRQAKDPLDDVARTLADSYRLICFDEFFVSDIADAMILGNLFRALFDRGVTLVATSNVPPNDLYTDGLQRARFLPAIDLLLEHTQVVHVDGQTDHRLSVLEKADVYQHPLGAAADAKLAQYFHAIAPDEGRSDVTIELLGRPMLARRDADGVIWFDFGEICDGPRSQNDYIELSRCYQTVLVSNVPVLDESLENQARRFVALVDEFYDRRVKLMLSAAAPLKSLYQGKRLAFEFQRTSSRLEEMQSHDYLASPHIA